MPLTATTPAQIVVRKLLQKLGFAVTVVGNGREAVDAWHASGDAFDLVLLDLNMPVMGGMSAARAIASAAAREGRWCPPMLALSAAVAEHDIAECLEAGMVGHLSKPCSRHTLEEIRRIVLAYPRATKGGGALPAADEEPSTGGAAAQHVALPYLPDVELQRSVPAGRKP